MPLWVSNSGDFWSRFRQARHRQLSRVPACCPIGPGHPAGLCVCAGAPGFGELGWARPSTVFTIHATKKLLDWVKQPVHPQVVSIEYACSAGAGRDGGQVGAGRWRQSRWRWTCWWPERSAARKTAMVRSRRPASRVERASGLIGIQWSVPIRRAVDVAARGLAAEERDQSPGLWRSWAGDDLRSPMAERLIDPFDGIGRHGIRVAIRLYQTAFGSHGATAVGRTQLALSGIRVSPAGQ